MARPSDYPPRFSEAEVMATPADQVGAGIEVGVLIVGGGPAGLACAIRLGQLLGRSPDVRAGMGEIAIAVVEKGRHIGSHLLSGALINPKSLFALFEGRLGPEDLPLRGKVEREATYFLTKGRALRVPTPTVMRNDGNYVVSLSELGRWLGNRAEEVGAFVLTETAAEKLLVREGRVVGVRTGDKGREGEGSRGRRFEPGVDIIAGVTVLAEGAQGHLTTAGIDLFDLNGTNPRVWSLGVKEVWKVPRAPDRVMHTVGWPLRIGGRHHEFGGAFVYPMGNDVLTVGLVVGLGYRDAELSVHDLLQELKTHPLMRGLFEGGERVAWGAKVIPEGGFYSVPKRLYAPGLLIVGDGAGLVNVPALKGIHYGIESGRLAGDAVFSALKRSGSYEVEELAEYDRAVRTSYIWKDLWRVRNVRQGFDRGVIAGAVIGAAAMGSRGRFPARALRVEADAAQTLAGSGRASRYPRADSRLTFDKSASVFLSGNRSGDTARDNIVVERTVAVEVADMWVHMCPAGVYEIAGMESGVATVDVRSVNCIQCGAIGAKGGRLTPAEGGAGPEYTLT